jgi:hypothetical protein
MFEPPDRRTIAAAIRCRVIGAGVAASANRTARSP